MRQGRRQVRIEIYNPSDFRDDVEVFGHFYHFEPMDVGRCGCAEHNEKGAEDNVGCHEVLTFPRDEKTNRLLTNLARVVANEGSSTADVVADFITSPECRGQRGFVRLEGEPRERAEQRAKARETWVGLYILQVEEAISNWEAHVAALKQTSPGSPAPVRPRDIADKYEWRRRHRDAVSMVPRGKHVCATCGDDYETPAQLAAHIQEEHPGIAHEAVHAGVFAAVAAETASPAVPAPAPTAPPVEDEAVKRAKDLGVRLLGRADAAGMALTKGDRKGLEFGDPDVVGDISDRLAVFVKQATADKQKTRTAKPEPEPAGATA